MGNKLSYSAIETYRTCGFKYKLHYSDRIRETTKSSALFFGSAVDKGLEASLQFPDQDEKLVFDKLWTEQPINGVPVQLAGSPFIDYSASNFDIDLLTEEDKTFLSLEAYDLINDLFVDCECNLEVAMAVVTANRKTKTWTDEQHQWYNACNWRSLRRKGHLILEANRKHVLPMFKKIVSTQKAIELTNGDDTLIGYIDCIVELEDGCPIILDYKTSSVKYKPESVKESTQLAIYCHAEGISTAGYVVFNKHIRKNRLNTCATCGKKATNPRVKTCDDVQQIGNGATKRCGGLWNTELVPEVDIQIIIDTMPEAQEDLVLRYIEEANVGIKDKVFEKNFSSCQQKWGRCGFYDLCHGGSMEGLEKVK